MSEGISIREFGRRIDMSAEGVRKAIAQGRIPKSCMGEITLSSGRKRPCIIDPEAAAQALDRNTDKTQQRASRETVSKARKAAEDEKRGRQTRSDEDDLPRGRNSNIPTITESKALKEAYLARIAKIDHDEKIGKLVDANKVKIEITNMITAAKNKLLSVPSRARGKLAHLTVDDIEYFEELISEALEELSHGS